MKIKGMIFRLILISVAGFGFTACYNNQTDMASVTTDQASTGSLSEEEAELEKTECRFVSVNTMRSILINQLGIASGDVPIGGGVTGNYLTNYARSFGEGNAAQGIASETSCSSLKFKLATQLMVQACVQSYTADQNAFMSRFFPSGTSNYDALFLTFVGRYPKAEEADAIKGIFSAVPADKAPAAACASVASSLEVLTQG